MQPSDPRLFAKAVAAFQTSRHDDAERDFKKVLRGDPKHFGALNLYAILLMQTGRVREAEPLLRKAVAVDARSDASFYNFGIALKQLNKPVEALEAFSRSLALKPGNAETWNNRGTVLNDLARYAEAIEDFDKSLAINPTYAEAMSNRARSLFLLQRYDEGASAYDQALKINPNLPEAWMGRGSLHFRMKRWDDALAAFQTAINLRGNFQEAWVAAGNSLLELERHSDAIRTFETAVGLDRGNATAWIGLANALQSLDQNEKALDACNTAIRISPNSPELLLSQGKLLAQMGLNTDALAAFDKVLRQHTNNTEALVGRGNVLKNLLEYDDAILAYDRAIVENPGSAEARLGRGNVLLEMKRLDDALAEYDRALAISSELAEVWFGRGLALTRQNEFDAAGSAFDRALSIRPNFAEALVGYGFLMNVLERRDDALLAYNKAIEIDPVLAEAWHGRATVLNEFKSYLEAKSAFAEALKIKSDFLFAKGDFLFCKAMLCDWSDHDVEWATLSADVDGNLPVLSPFPALSLGISAEQQFKVASMYIDATCGGGEIPARTGDTYEHERLRIGYFSPDLRDHAVAHLISGVFENHDHTRFEIIGLSVGADDQSAMRDRLSAAFDRFIDCCNVPDQKLADMIRDMEIDILIDLAGHTTGSRPSLFAARPAPVQATYLGYAGTTGANFIDYIIADPTVVPSDRQLLYSEKVAYLPDCYLPNDRSRPIGQAPSRSEAGLPSSGFVFCSFNKPYKITPDVFDVWMRLLIQIPGSVLWLSNFGERAHANLQAEAQQRGVSGDRLIFAGFTDRQEDHLARIGLADLFLDTPDYNAHSTACDALWAGVPLVTCIGSTFAGRVGASTLNAVGLPELITTSLKDYEAMALKLATDPALLASVRTKLASQRLTTPLFDTERFTRNLEALYLKMWERAQAGEAPASLSL